MARLLLAIFFAFLVLSSVALSLPSARPETGHVIRDIDRSGYGQLVVHNGWTMDTVVALINLDMSHLNMR